MAYSVAAPESGIASAQEQLDAQLAALQRERDGYARHGLDERVADVDAAIKAATKQRAAFAPAESGEQAEQATIAPAEAEHAVKPKAAPRRRAPAKG